MIGVLPPRDEHSLICLYRPARFIGTYLLMCTDLPNDDDNNDRYTKAGDTVVSLSAERHNVVEGALERSRRVEVLVSDAQSKDQVRDNLKTSFSRAHKYGKWKVIYEGFVRLFLR